MGTTNVSPANETGPGLAYACAEVVLRVQARECPPLRPVVSAGRDCPEALLDLMERCWEDGVDDRPSFETIRGEVRRIMK